MGQNPFRKIPRNNLGDIQETIDYILEHLGEIKLDGLDDLGLIIYKIDNETIIIEDGKLKASIDVKQNLKYVFSYDNTSFPNYPSEIELFDIVTNDPKGSFEYTYDINGMVTRELERNEAGSGDKTVDITYSTSGGRVNIAEAEITDI